MEDVKVYGPYTSVVKSSYISLRSLYVGAKPVKEGALRPGQVTVSVQGNDKLEVIGNLVGSNNVLSGLSGLYGSYDIKENTELKFHTWHEAGDQFLEVILPAGAAQSTQVAPAVGAAIQTPASGAGSVFQRKKLKYIHLEEFRPENLFNWQPETETDVFMAFGVLQQYTDIKYCCGASKAVIDRLGYTYQMDKPDAIVINRISNEYMIAEWKKKSSDFKINHLPDDVDVLVCWNDDEKDRTRLPPLVISLNRVATKVASELFADEG